MTECEAQGESSRVAHVERAPRVDEWLFLALVALLPIARPPALSVLGFSLPACDLVFVAAACAWAFAVARGRARFKRSWFYLPLALYLGAMIASTLASADLRRSAVKLAGEVYLIGLAVLTFNLLSSVGFFRRFAKAWLAGTAATAAVGLAGAGMFYAGFKDGSINLALAPLATIPPGDYPRVYALFANPNMLCNYLSVSFSVGLTLMLLGGLGKVRSLLFVAVVWATALFTLSPGLGGLSLSTGLWVRLRLKDAGRPVLGGLILGGSGVAALCFFAATTVAPAPTAQNGIVARVAGGYAMPLIRREIEPSPRVFTWRGACQTFRRHPVLGRGLGLDVSPVVYWRTLSGSEHYLTDAHNTWLSIAGQGGVVGLLAFTSILLYLARLFQPIRLKGGEGMVIKAGLTIAFIDAFLYQGLTGSFEDTRHLWVLIGALAAAPPWVSSPNG